MNYLIQSALAADPNRQQPLPVASLLFIQDSTKEAINSIILERIGTTYSTSKAYILYGCELTGTNPGARTVSEGALFFNGEIYSVPSASVTTTGSQVLVGTVTITNPSPDPILLKDGTSTSVHNVRKVVFSNAASGSGSFNESDLTNIIKISVELSNASQATSSGTYVDMTSLSYTTTKTAKYRVRLLVDSSSAHSGTGASVDVQTGARYRIYNSTDSVVLDEKSIQSRIALNVSCTLDLTTEQTVVCERVMTIASGKTIKAQFQTINNSTTATNSYLFVEEL